MSRKKKTPPPTETPKMSDMSRAWAAAARRKRRVRTAEGTTMVPHHEALIAKTLETAGNGSPHAQRLALHAFEAALAEERAEIEANNARWRSIERRQRAVLEEALSRGDPEPRLLPHPDDIEFRPDERPRIVGALTEEDDLALETAAQTRDAYVVEDAYLRAEEGRRKDPTIEPWGPYYMALLTDMQLPPSKTVGGDHLISQRMRLARVPKRELHKLRREAWARAGVDIRRGQPTPPPAAMRAAFDCSLEAAALLQQTDMPAAEMNARCEDMSERYARRFLEAAEAGRAASAPAT